MDRAALRAAAIEAVEQEAQPRRRGQKLPISAAVRRAVLAELGNCLLADSGGQFALRAYQSC